MNRHLSSRTLVVLCALVFAALVPVFAASGALMRLDTAATVTTWTESNPPARDGYWSNVDRINDGVFEHTPGQDPHWYSGFVEGGVEPTPNSGWLAYSWAEPQRISNIVAVVGHGGVQTSYGSFEPWRIEYSTVGLDGPWEVLHGPDTTPTQKVLHLAVDLEEVVALRLFSEHERGSHQRFQEFAVYGGDKPPTSVTSPVAEPGFTTIHSINPGIGSFNPDELVDPIAPREWARESGLSDGVNGQGIEWRGYWPDGVELGGIILWGGASGGVNYYYPSVNTHELYILNRGADIDSLDPSDWTLLSDAQSALLKDGAAVEILFSGDSVFTHGVRLVQTGDPAQYNFSLYGGHMVFLTGQVPEPASFGLLLLASSVFLTGRRRRVRAV